MQNKITQYRFNKSQSNSTCYRSIRYNITTSTIQTPERIKTIQNSSSYIKTMKQSIAKKASSLSTGQVTKFKRYRTIQNIESSKKAKKMSYLQTWRTLLDKVQFKGPECRIEAKNELTTLPTLKEFQNSQFTILDPINLPIDFISKQINQANRQMSKCKEDVTILKSQLNRLNYVINAQLDEDRQEIQQKIGRLKQMLVIDGIKHQQIKLRNKREIKQLLSEQKQFKLTVQSYKKKIISIQEVIFQSRPFDLERIEDESIYGQRLNYF